MLSAQILLDDEWHGVNYVIGKTFLDVLTKSYSPTSTLMDFYRLFLYHTFGWSEFALRLPSVLAGLLSLILFPLLVRKVFNERVAITFAFLLVISPFLIFYSRFSRSYSLVTFFCFWALLLFYEWLTTGKQRHAVGFILTGGFAVHAHLFSVVAVFTPLTVAFGILIFNHFNRSSPMRFPIKPSFKSLLTVSFIVILLILLLLFPVLLQSSHLPWAKEKLTSHGFITLPTLISGTANIPLTAIFFALCIAGYVLLFKQKPLLAWVFLPTICAYILSLIIARPKGMDTAVVLLRYMIVLIPITLSTVALAIDSLHQQLQKRIPVDGVRRTASALIVMAFTALLFITGPLPAIYTAPNNFTNHSAFQGSYQPYTWEYSDARHVYPAFSAARARIPHFYHWLAEQPHFQSIIEYPFDICNYNNLFYYYQHFHKRRTIAGYCSDSKLLGYALDKRLKSRTDVSFTVGILSADQILSCVSDPKKLTFHNMVDITDIAAISRSQADFIVLHKFVMALKIMPDRIDSLPVYYRSVPHFDSQFRQFFGPPAYEDAQIICFRIKPADNTKIQ
jgi:hypothetical protein